MPNEDKALELLYWKKSFAYTEHLLRLPRLGSREALVAGRESLLILQDKLLKAVTGGHIKAAKASEIKIFPSDFGGDTQEREKLYCFFERILLATGNTLSILQKALAFLPKMTGERDMSQEEIDKGIEIFSAINDAFKRALGNKK